MSPDSAHRPAPRSSHAHDPAPAHTAAHAAAGPDRGFGATGLCRSVLDALREEGYHTPTPIQAQSIPPIIAGRDLLGCAQTGTGKTAAFALPILHNLLSGPADKSHRGPHAPRVLILSPTRELATQIGDSFATYGRHSGLRHTVIFGGVGQGRQVQALQRGVDILVATPGRLIDLMQQGHVNLTRVGVFVLDEADRMLDMGFIHPIRRVAAALPEPRQTLLFSATMPREIMHLADSLLRDPVKVTVTPIASAAPLITQSVYVVPRNNKQALLEHLLGDGTIVRALVFTRTKHGADRVTKRLHHAGIAAEAIHGNKNQNQRQRALDAFRSGRSRVLVATDVAARGIDVDGVTHVFNFDLPMEPESYVHRIGRTGRAGAKGTAIAFCDGDERDLLRAIEKLTGKKVPSAGPVPELPARREQPEPDSDRDHGDRRERGGPRPRHEARPARPGSPQPRGQRPAKPEHSRRQEASRSPVGRAPARPQHGAPGHDRTHRSEIAPKPPITARPGGSRPAPAQAPAGQPQRSGATPAPEGRPGPGPRGGPVPFQQRGRGKPHRKGPRPSR
ncbi:MAG: DEAD/DEAH box helicase [Phycisphaerales bacterium]|nr:DEAD/DEAH box helicase [Phycisphaerales bacterium]